MNKNIEQFVLGGSNSHFSTSGASPNDFFTPGGLLGTGANKKKVVNLGIQAPEGTYFYINNSDSPGVVGKTGIFEWDVEGYGYIEDLYFKLPNNVTISAGNNGEDILNNYNPNEYILVNICYVT